MRLNDRDERSDVNSRAMRKVILVSRMLLTAVVVVTAYWAFTASSAEAIGTFLGSIASLLATFVVSSGGGMPHDRSVAATAEVRSKVDGRPSWLISERFFGVATTMGAPAVLFLLLPCAWLTWTAWEWSIQLDHWPATLVAAVLTFLTVVEIAFLVWVAATFVYEIADPE